jgi:hypothetical protein
MKGAFGERPAAEEKVQSFRAVTSDVHAVCDSIAAQSNHGQLHVRGIVFDI